MNNGENELELLETILEARRELETANRNFESAESELVDYYAYQIKATKIKMDYLIKQVKQKEISVDMVNNLKLRIKERKAI